MTGKDSNGRMHATEPEYAAAGASPVENPPFDRRRRSPWPLAILAAIFIIVPFFAWYGTWFGRALSDEKIEEYLREGEKPRHTQHALSQISDRMARGDRSASRWYPQIVAVAESPVTDLRMTAAWVMGQDNGSEEFHTALLRLLRDEEPIVRRNAALALVRFKDGGGREELRLMLRSYSIFSPTEGRAQTVLSEGTPVKREAMLARYVSRTSSGAETELRSPLAGTVEKVLIREGEEFPGGRELFVLSPDPASVWEALRALYLVGEREDLEDIERYARGVAGMHDKVKEQAALTAEAIKRRSAEK